MQITTIRPVPQTSGWLTDAINTAKKLLPGQQPSTVNVNLPEQQHNPWTVPAIVVGASVIAFALFSGRRRK